MSIKNRRDAAAALAHGSSEGGRYLAECRSRKNGQKLANKRFALVTSLAILLGVLFCRKPGKRK